MKTTDRLLGIAAASLLLSLIGAPRAFGQLSMGQQTCLNMLNKDGAGVARQQGKADVSCVRNKGLGKLTTTAEVCLTADPKGALGKKEAHTTSDDMKRCTPPPSFGYTGATATNNGAVQAKLDLTHDVYGANLDAAVISCGSSKPGCQCQQKVSTQVETVAATKLAEFLLCKRATLKGGGGSAASLAACVNDAGKPGSIAADTKGKIEKRVAGLGSTIGKSCDTPGVTAGAFPGKCNGMTGAALASCLDAQIECRVCQMINDVDGLFVNCDLFDDDEANASCASGTGPTPTPTPSPTPTPTPTPTPPGGGGTVLKGALTATNGRFNYNLMVGLPGANSACNTSFPGTHVCTYAELQAAQTAGDLVGLKDTGNNAVTSFWAIDASQPALQQCNDDSLGGSGLNWEYGTAHTASRGEKVALTNGTGVLGSLQMSLQCNLSGMSWVGCCQ